ncbi:hypothetical protein [Sporomusa sp. KB1]|uniref:hypothetical protein n=1 Tax=Sporomusa sp. KB1 TaxID=943346 RepID=UPI0011A1F486|nr:hypothetical protein [Sporomusa sp. KB1]
MWLTNGYMAKANAHKNIAILQDYVKKGYPIITACTNVKNEHPIAVVRSAYKPEAAPYDKIFL